MTKSDYIQYQQIMEAVFVKKTCNDMQLSSVDIITNLTLDKLALRAFNHLIYNQKISSPLMANYLLGLPNHYTLSDNMKSINLAIF